MACGPALQKRWGQPAETFPLDHKIWDLESTYLALAVHNLVCILSPRRVILGGGVMQQTHLFPLIRAKVKTLLNQYVAAPEILDRHRSFYRTAGIGQPGRRAGSCGPGKADRNLAGQHMESLTPIELKTEQARVRILYLTPQAVRVTHTPLTGSGFPPDRPWLEHVMLPQVPVSRQEIHSYPQITNNCVVLRNSSDDIIFAEAAPVTFWKDQIELSLSIKKE